MRQARHRLQVSGMNPAPTRDNRIGEETAVLARLSALDRFLPLWILLAMAGGLLLGHWFASIQGQVEAFKLGQISMPIVLGPRLMMDPVLAKLLYGEGAVVPGIPLSLYGLFVTW